MRPDRASRRAAEPTSAHTFGASTASTGRAGSSARREYERRRQSRERLTRERHPRIGGLLLALRDEPQSERSWAVGAAGEEAVPPSSPSASALHKAGRPAIEAAYVLPRSVLLAGEMLGQMGNSPRRSPTIPNELAARNPAFQSTPTHSGDLAFASHNPKVEGSNPAPAIRRKATSRAAFGVLGGIQPYAPEI